MTVLIGGAGDDKLKGSIGNDTIMGGAGNDELDGGSGDHLIMGGGGKDTLKGGAGDDNLVGDDGNDVLIGGSENDTMWGEEGYDLLKAESGNDTLYGGSGDDVLNGGSGNNRLDPDGDDLSEVSMSGAGTPLIDLSSLNWDLGPPAESRAMSVSLIPSSPWVGSFVGDLAIIGNTSDPNSDIHVVLTKEEGN
jgi:hypothetical protein